MGEPTIRRLCVQYGGRRSTVPLGNEVQSSQVPSPCRVKQFIVRRQTSPAELCASSSAVEVVHFGDPGWNPVVRGCGWTRCTGGFLGTKPYSLWSIHTWYRGSGCANGNHPRPTSIPDSVWPSPHFVRDEMGWRGGWNATCLNRPSTVTPKR